MKLVPSTKEKFDVSCVFRCVSVRMHACVCVWWEGHLWLGSMVVRGASGCEAAEPVAWLEKRRCAIALGKKASCSLTTLGMLMESSAGQTETDLSSHVLSNEIGRSVRLESF